MSAHSAHALYRTQPVLHSLQRADLCKLTAPHMLQPASVQGYHARSLDLLSLHLSLLLMQRVWCGLAHCRLSQFQTLSDCNWFASQVYSPPASPRAMANGYVGANRMLADNQGQSSLHTMPMIGCRQLRSRHPQLGRGGGSTTPLAQEREHAAQ